MASISFNPLFPTSSSSHGFSKATHHLFPSALFPSTSLPDLCSKISTGLPLTRKFSSLSTKGSRPAGVAYATAATEKSVHDFTVKDIDGKDVSLGKFKGKVLLIVNVASKCGLTDSNYTELSHIYEKYKSQGFDILAFPCNQFGGQEPGSNSDIKQFACTRFKAEFPIFDKVEVNGPNTAPIYKFLKSSAGGFLGDVVKWNFEKFLVDKNGKVVKRYPPTTSPFQIEVIKSSTLILVNVKTCFFLEHKSSGKLVKFKIIFPSPLPFFHLPCLCQLLLVYNIKSHPYSHMLAPFLFLFTIGDVAVCFWLLWMLLCPA